MLKNGFGVFLSKFFFNALPLYCIVFATRRRERPWNCTCIVRDFLFLAAGYDARGRSLLVREGEPPSETASRAAWYRRRGVGFCLNMAGSGHQHELRGAAYPEVPGGGRPLELKRIDLNDVDHWDAASMRPGFEAGARFIEGAFNAFVRDARAWRDRERTLRQQRLDADPVEGRTTEAGDGAARESEHAQPIGQQRGGVQQGAL